jgi:hypothetical protein
MAQIFSLDLGSEEACDQRLDRARRTAAMAASGDSAVAVMCPIFRPGRAEVLP